METLDKTGEVKYIGRKVISTLTCTMDSDEYWSAVMVVEHQRSKDLENWESKAASLKVIDKDPDKAAQKAIMTISSYLQTVHGDLFEEVDKQKEMESNAPESVENT